MDQKNEKNQLGLKDFDLGMWEGKNALSTDGMVTFYGQNFEKAMLQKKDI